eukprot:Pgem_evm1s13040
MLFNSNFISLISFTALNLAVNTNALWTVECDSTLIANVDPIVSPGEIAGHEH